MNEILSYWENDSLSLGLLHITVFYKFIEKIAI